MINNKLKKQIEDIFEDVEMKTTNGEAQQRLHGGKNKDISTSEAIINQLLQLIQKREKKL